MGDKINARNAVAAIGMPVAPGTARPIESADEAVAAATGIGYPIMVKASAGGGGMGMAIAADDEQLRQRFDTVQSFAQRVFHDGGVLLERFYPDARHVEVQVVGLADGRVVALGERNCSVQRRNQKLAEETPCPDLDPALRARMLAAAMAAAESVGYVNAGTIECLVHGERGEQDFVFLEMNTRLQVEHPVTEAVFGVDLVEEQLRIACGLDSPNLLAATPAGHAIEFRINAEDPKMFLPRPGVLGEWAEPAGAGIRFDAGYTTGNTVSPSYDSLLAKLVVHGDDRAQALARAREAIATLQSLGPRTNVAFFAELLDEPVFVAGTYTTSIVTSMRSPVR